MSDSQFQGGPGKVHPKQRRKAAMPSDIECNWCGAVIENDEQCYEVRKGFNSYGGFTALETPKQLVICPGCVE